MIGHGDLATPTYSFVYMVRVHHGAVVLRRDQRQVPLGVKIQVN